MKERGKERGKERYRKGRKTEGEIQREREKERERERGREGRRNAKIRRNKEAERRSILHPFRKKQKGVDERSYIRKLSIVHQNFIRSICALHHPFHVF